MAVKDRYFTDLEIVPKVKFPLIFDMNDEDIGKFLKDLKKTKEIILDFDLNFERVGLISEKEKEKVLREIDEKINLCNHYFKTKERNDLNKWLIMDEYKPYEWNEPRQRLSYTNGIVKAIIDIFRNEKSIKIESYLINDSEFITNFSVYPEYAGRFKKVLRSEKSLKKYLNEMKPYLKNKVEETKYNKREREFEEFLSSGGKNGD